MAFALCPVRARLKPSKVKPSNAKHSKVKPSTTTSSFEKRSSFFARVCARVFFCLHSFFFFLLDTYFTQLLACACVCMYVADGWRPRSISIFDSDAKRVWDSGDSMETYMAEDDTFVKFFNSEGSELIGKKNEYENKMHRIYIETHYCCDYWSFHFRRESANITGVHNNQDQIWFVKIGEYRGFTLIAGPDYYGPP